jgi:hypothetical protein
MPVLHVLDVKVVHTILLVNVYDFVLNIQNAIAACCLVQASKNLG